MDPSKKSQHAIRRSTRLALEVPVQLVSLDAASYFSEMCNTTLVNAHGCGLISPRPLVPGARVRVEIVSAKRHTIARVIEVLPLSGDSQTWLVGLELEIPGNFWGIEYAPSDWKMEKTAETPSWRLTDLSVGACYLESGAPFPADTSVLISIRARDREFRFDGVVRVSYPQAGMGVEFTRVEHQRLRVEELIGRLISNGEVPSIFVVRKAGQRAAAKPGLDRPLEPETPDPLLDLVLKGDALTAQQFLYELRKQRAR